MKNQILKQIFWGVASILMPIITIFILKLIYCNNGVSWFIVSLLAIPIVIAIMALFSGFVLTKIDNYLIVVIPFICLFLVYMLVCLSAFFGLSLLAPTGFVFGLSIGRLLHKRFCKDETEK